MTKVSNPPIRSARIKLERKLRQAIQALQEERIAKPFASKLGEAIDLALDNRLIGVIGHPGRKQKRGSELLDFCNVQLKDTELSYAARHHLEMRGVLYVGELLRMTWDRKSVVRREIVTWLLGHGVSHPHDVVGAGWIPPYATDYSVLQAWDEPIEWLIFRGAPIDFSNSPRWWYWTEEWISAQHNQGIHYLGHLGLRKTVSSVELHRLHETIGQRLPIRAGMVASGWTPNSKPAPEWERHRAAVALKQQLMARADYPPGTFPNVLPPLSAVSAWLKLSPDVFNLSVRSSNAMRALEITTVGQLVAYQAKDLLSWRNFGRKSLREILDALNTLGLRLGMSPQEIEEAAGKEEVIP